MNDRGANPFIVTNGGETWAERTQHLPNVTKMRKSIYFTTRPLPDEFKAQNEFPDPWFYKTGVFDGKFDSTIGQGASGTVISGEWYGKKAAFKFVEIGRHKFRETIPDVIKSLDKKLSEMTSIQATKGSKIVSFYGHYR